MNSANVQNPTTKVLFRQLLALMRLSFVELWRRNDVFVLLILSLALLVPLSLASPFGATGASRFLDEVALLLIWGFSLFVSLGTGSRLFPPEFDSRTIYPLLAKPLSRGRLLVGKFCGAFAATGSALGVFYALFLGVLALRGGTVLSLEVAQAFLLHLLASGLMVALALFFSLVVTRSAALTLSAIAAVGMFLFGRSLPEYAQAVSAPLAALMKVVYVVFPHFEFFDMRQRVIHGWGPVDGWAFLAVCAYALVYGLLLLGAAQVVLRRKRL